MTGLRRVLRPLKPVLRPIWHRVRWLNDRTPVRFVWRTAGRAAYLAAGVANRGGGRTSPIRPLSRLEIVLLGLRVPYYRPRGVYMSAASHIADDMIRRRQLTSALELGPYLRSLIVGADVLDLTEQPEREVEGRTMIHNATRLPWPVGDKAYDLFVGLQVFEHLGTSQPAVFREVRRVARHAILSLPIDWVMSNPNNCHHGITEEAALAWFAPVVPTRIELGNTGHRKRVIFVFEDLPPAEPTASPTDSGSELIGVRA